MKAFIELLKQTNHYFIKFKKLSVQEYTRLQKGAHLHKNTFYYNRQVILDTIFNINKTLNTMEIKKNISVKDKKIIVYLLKEKQKIILDIVKQDIALYSYLEGDSYNIVEYQTA